jgi:hypothetical protein
VPLPDGRKAALIEQEPPGASVAGQLFVCEKTVWPAVAIDEIVSTESPVLERVNTWELVVPVRCSGNVTEDGEKEPTGASPVPATGTVRFEAGAPTLTARFPDAGPRAVGTKVTLTAQLAPAASEAPQLFVCANGVDTAIELIESADVPVLESVRTCDELVVPTNCEANVKDAGETEATGATPVPKRATLWFGAGAKNTIRLLVAGPVELGANITLTVHVT